MHVCYLYKNTEPFPSAEHKPISTFLFRDLLSPHSMLLDVMKVS